ncbi:hypothetical protein ACF07Y_43010 [Streptomyces sp. NPDC016566]|uniref:hypothetical protein n=1 Tax=Streptomyces sp. NPDC016566 TaxID=3364967 RepID=UPI0036FA8D2D
MNTHAPYQEDSSPAGHLVVLGSGPQAEWERAMQRLASSGPLLLIDDESPSWQHPHVADVRTADLLSPEQVLKAALEFAANRPIAGVLNFQAAHTRAAELVRQELRLPGPSAAMIEATTLRHRTAELLASAGVDNGGAIHADTYDQALESAHQVGFSANPTPRAP